MRAARLLPAHLALVAALAAALAAGGARAAAPAPLSPRLVDAFESVDGWSARPADGVEMKLSTAAGLNGHALRVDFRFVKGGGYAVLHRDLALELPADYRFSFQLRGECPPNNLEFKLVDSSGANVWWSNQRGYEFPRAWRRVSLKKRQISFAWGPAGGGEIRHVAAIELAVTAGTGGAGTIWLDDLALTPLPPPAATPPPVVVGASSASPGHEPARAADGDPATAWRSAPGDSMPWLALDLGTEREYGGLVVDWADGGHPGDYVVEASEEGATWRTLREVHDGRRARDPLYLPESESRFVRARATRALQGGATAGIREIALRPIEWSATRAAFFQALAKDAPRGSFPRGMSGEQSYWTVVSVDGGLHKGLLGEDGAIETGRASFSIEPFLAVDGRLVTWADVRTVPSLAEGDLPIPAVRWRGPGVDLTVGACAFGPRDSSSILASYAVSNRSAARRRVTLYLAARPFQVNPPAQFLNTPGGTTPIADVRCEGRTLRVNGDRAVTSLVAPSRAGCATFDQGDIVDFLRSGRPPSATAARDPFDAASAAFAYDLDLPPGATREVDLVIPLAGGGAAAAPADPAQTGAWARAVRDSCRAAWRARLGAVTLALPAGALPAPVVPALEAQLGWILATRAGAALQPGPRAYARAWIRAGALISSALLRLGRPAPVRDFLEWFAPYQYEDGKVPCCVDARGSDPVPEHDSGGEFIFLVAEYYRYTGDRALAERMWPRVRGAAAYLDSLRHQRLGAEWRAAGSEPFYGILPPSISHEGYSANPMHSYWDDFFALRAFKDAAWLAGELGHADEAERLGAIRDTFARDLGASIAAAMTAHKIEYVPGCADLGDFDATSTAIALAPAQAEDLLPRGSLAKTFERYWTFFRDRSDSSTTWEAFTPYEMRNIGAMLRLGWRPRALEALDYFLRFMRPRGWLQWPEVVWRDERAPRFLGDLPHTWVGAEYVRSVLDLFAYDREADQSLVVGAGVPMSWVAPLPGLAVRGLGTPYGPLSYTIRTERGEVEVRIEAGTRVPPGGIAVRAPFEGPIRRASVNGVRVSPSALGEVIVRALPATVRLRPSGSSPARDGSRRPRTRE